jgi:hypothetical protein
MGADPARDWREAGLILVSFAGGELDQDLPFANRLTNTAGNGFNPAGAWRGQAKDGLHRLQHHKHITARDFLAFACH